MFKNIQKCLKTSKNAKKGLKTSQDARNVRIFSRSRRHCVFCRRRSLLNLFFKNFCGRIRRGRGLYVGLLSFCVAMYCIAKRPCRDVSETRTERSVDFFKCFARCLPFSVYVYQSPSTNSEENSFVAFEIGWPSSEFRGEFRDFD